MQKFSLLPFFFFLLSFGCRTSPSDTVLQEGDLIFQDLNCGALCDAIEAVTEGVNGKDFSHIGMVVKVNDKLEVLEAIGDRVQTTPLRTFFARSGDSVQVTHITVGRLKAEYASLIPEAVKYATSQIGMPYDDDYIMDNGRWYCSELLYTAFKKANREKELFDLNPMTFKDPATHDYFPAWVDYYKSLQVEIPEGKPGINPGGMSRCACIRIVPLASCPR